MISLYCNVCKQDHRNELAQWCDRSNLEIENEKLKKALEIAKEKLGFYGKYTTWDQEISLCGSDELRNDLEETYYSRYTPGQKARQALKEIEEVLNA